MAWHASRHQIFKRPPLPAGEFGPVLKASARAQLWTFLALTFLITGIFHYRFICFGGLEGNRFLTLPLMWTPGVCALVCSWIFGVTGKEIGFCGARLKQLGLAYLLPALSAVLVLLLLLVSGIDSFGIREKFVEKLGSEEQVVFYMLLVAPTWGVVVASFRGLGEEIGWRGFLHAKLQQLEIPQPSLVTGLLWSLWHFPLILFSDYATSDKPWFSAILFILVATSMSVFMGWQRRITGSIWPAALAHGAHNVWIQGIYPAFAKKGPLDPYFGGESGVFLAIIYLGVAVFLTRRVARPAKSARY